MSSIVQCRVCEYWYGDLSSHIRTHGLTKSEYQSRFPGAEIMSEDCRLAKCKAQLEVADQKSDSLRKVWTNYSSKERAERLSISSEAQLKASSYKSESQKASWARLSDKEKESRLAPMHLENKRKWDTISLEEKESWLESSFLSSESKEKATEGTTRAWRAKSTEELLAHAEFQSFIQTRVWESLSDKEKERRIRDSHIFASPNKLESEFLEFLETYFKGDWRYNGDRSSGKIIGGKIPDFIYTRNANLLIEIFGLYYHDTFIFPERMTESQLIAYYAGYGYRCLVIWECGFFNEDMRLRIKNFVEGGGAS